MKGDPNRRDSFDSYSIHLGTRRRDLEKQASHKMVFFDFNIPFLESPNQTVESSKDSRKNVRLKLVARAMELGYIGVAYNHSIKRVMADSDRCQIPLFPLSSLLKAAPALSATVQFHRRLLGVPLDSPFRQYTRLTVVVDSAVHAAALNSGNPVLRTYDLVAVRPLNQTIFDHACKVSEVDLISIDFSEKLPYRLKLPMVKAAIERGVYFEIAYSPLISDVQARRQMLTGAKLLVDWTRGKNLILSSAAPTANELRGPYDVANLSSLLGLSTESAKSAISKNCRALIAKAMRKKHFHKEAIRIEKIPNNEQLNSKGDWFGDWHVWDPISSGDGDLSLDDIGKFLSASHNVPKNSNGVDAVSAADGMPLSGMQATNQISGSGSLSLDTAPFYFGAMEFRLPAATKKNPSQSDGLDAVSVASVMPKPDTPLKGQISCSNGGDLLSTVEKRMPVTELSLRDQISCSEGLESDLIPTNDATVSMSVIKDLKPKSGCERERPLKETCEVMQQVNGSENVLLLLDDSLTLKASAEDVVSFAIGMPSCITLSKDCSDTNLASLEEPLTFSAPTDVMDHTESCNEDPRKSNRIAVDLAAREMPMDKYLIEKEENGQKDTMTACDVPLQDEFSEIKLRGYGADTCPYIDDVIIEDNFYKMKDPVKGVAVSVSNYSTKEEVVEVKERKQEVEIEQIKRVPMHKAKPVKGKHKRKTPYPALSGTFLGMLKPLRFKRKASQRKRMKS